MSIKSILFSTVGVLLIISSCKLTPTSNIMSADTLTADLQKRLITAEAGDVIELPAGQFEFKRSLSFTDIPDVTIKGAGKGKTILSFKNQIEGAEGLLVKNTKGITLEGFTVVDSKGDAIKVQESSNVIMRDLETTWTTGKQPTNGAYGLYPVTCTGVLMEDCEASFAMDAGIYVGQSNDVVVRNNYVHDNVAGLEIENTINGEVYGNRAENNAGGMLIFAMPDLPQPNGDRIKFYDNHMENNNGANFAPDGMIVSTIPPGSGMILMSHKNIEVYNNRIIGHKSLGISVSSWFFTGVPFESKEFDPYCSNIHIHDNEISGTQGPADMTTDFGKLIHAVMEGKAYDILIDGIFKPGEPRSYCFANNGDITFINLNAAMGAEPADMIKNQDHDLEQFNCEGAMVDTKGHNEWLIAKR